MSPHIRVLSLASLLLCTGCIFGIKRIEVDVPRGTVAIDMYEPTRDAEGNDIPPEDSDTAGRMEIDTSTKPATAKIEGVALFSGEDSTCTSEGGDLERLAKRLRSASTGDAIDLDYEKTDGGCVNVTVTLSGSTSLSTAGSDTYDMTCCPDSEVR